MPRAGFILGVVAIAACTAFESSTDAPNPPTVGAEAGAPIDGGASGTTPDSAVIDSGGVDPDGSTTADFASTVKSIPGLVAYWHLDDVDTQTATDMVGGNDGSYKATVAQAPGLLGDGEGKAADFIGGAIVVRGDLYEDLKTFDHSVTVGALVRPHTSTFDRIVIQKFGSFVLGVRADQPFFETHHGDTTNRQFSGLHFAINVRTFMVGVFDEKNLTQTFWINGAIAVKQAGQKALAPANVNDICLAGSSIGTDTQCDGYRFNGVIDEAFVANAAIGDDVVMKLAKLAGY